MTTTNGISEELNEIKCVVRPYNQPAEQYPLIRIEEIAQKFTAEVVEFLQMQGVNVVNAYAPPQFGGVNSSFLQGLLDLLKSFRVISAIITLIKGILFLAEKGAERTYAKGNIYIHVNLSISSTIRATNDTYYDDISKRLEYLLRMAKTSAEKLQKRYPLYSFGFNTSVSLSANEFSATFSHHLIDGEYVYTRIVNSARRVRVTEAMHLNVVKARFALLKHTISRPTLITGSPYYERDYRWISEKKTYYALFSSKIISEFKYVKKTMPYAHYYEKYLK